MRYKEEQEQIEVFFAEISFLEEEAAFRRGLSLVPAERQEAALRMRKSGGSEKEPRGGTAVGIRSAEKRLQPASRKDRGRSAYILLRAFTESRILQNFRDFSLISRTPGTMWLRCLRTVRSGSILSRRGM